MPRSADRKSPSIHSSPSFLKNGIPDNLEAACKFPEIYNLQTTNYDEAENLNRPIKVRRLNL